MRNTKPVLLVEDDVIDMMTVRRAFKDLNLGNPLAHASNGEQALQYLNDPERPKPCVILLDLNMPRMNGIEFMRVVKTDPVLRRIPVIVLTTSKNDRDIVDTYDLSAAGYIVKPVDYRSFVDTIRAVNIYWTISELPDEMAETHHVECLAHA